jgi:hypothetical protein
MRRMATVGLPSAITASWPACSRLERRQLPLPDPLTPFEYRSGHIVRGTADRSLANDDGFHRLLDPPRPVAYPRDLAGLGVGSSLMGAAAAQGSHGAGQPHENSASLPVQSKPLDGSKWNKAREIDWVRARLSGSHDRCE